MEKGKKYSIKISFSCAGREGKIVFKWLKESKLANENSELMNKIKDMDIAVIVAGVKEGEGKDRSDLNLLKETEKLIRDIKNILSFKFC